MKKILLLSALCATFMYADVAVLLPEEKRTFNQSKYIPDISAVVDFSYVDNSVNNDEIGHLGLPGIAHGLLGEHKDGDKTDSTYNAKEGFNLNYVELILSSNADPFFSVDAVLHFSQYGVDIEEAYFTSTALGNGLRARGGKLLSNFGYQNAQHHHYWDFGDMPLVFESFLGTHGINELGAQLQWTAPTPFYLMAGLEVLQGENEKMFGNESYKDADGEAIIQGASAPSLYVGYLKTSFDFDYTTVFAGVSYAQGDSLLNHSDDDVPNVFSGESRLYGADLVVLHSFDSYSSIKWQSEWLSREMDGVQYDVNSTSITGTLNIEKRQSGLYSQLVYTHDRNWKFGIRYDTIYQNDIKEDGADINEVNNFHKYSAMVEYHPSEFSRFRLQYNKNDAMYNEDGNKQSINTIMLQANIAIGAHSAHSF
ncbi:hypothetical protein HUE87_00310 [Candidatus Sulfurimonas marisnigri]|uniref:Zinc-regulated TonB-dependent outer membrane receptor n=1 Tax=Candidatus Sulfurimonas marisnigri TaxID=2740405 RepID=A0A7S7M091_9BACT|nr:hypothetical protein [Candidatus Sulfurimonas marisnigri]QOY54728.1 hypothetical protein HUE87_00310 [Candidatus Sulfurimonas marisnigri]